MSNTEKREGISCPACGGNLTSRFNRSNHDIKSFSYNNHNFGIRKCSSTHYIRLDFLEQVVLMVGRSADQGTVVGAKKSWKISRWMWTPFWKRCAATHQRATMHYNCIVR